MAFIQIFNFLIWIITTGRNFRNVFLSCRLLWLLLQLLLIRSWHWKFEIWNLNLFQFKMASRTFMCSQIFYCCLRRNEITVKGNYRNERKTKTEIGALFTFWYNDWQKKAKNKSYQKRRRASLHSKHPLKYYFKKEKK